MGRLLLPIYTPIVRDGDQVSGEMDGSSRMWCHGTEAGEFR